MGTGGGRGDHCSSVTLLCVPTEPAKQILQQLGGMKVRLGGGGLPPGVSVPQVGAKPLPPSPLAQHAGSEGTLLDAGEPLQPPRSWAEGVVEEEEEEEEEALHKDSHEDGDRDKNGDVAEKPQEKQVSSPPLGWPASLKGHTPSAVVLTPTPPSTFPLAGDPRVAPRGRCHPGVPRVPSMPRGA